VYDERRHQHCWGHLPQSQGYKAFTLLEVMTVVAIIAILATVLFVGARGLLSGGRERATRVTLASLHGMLGELDARTRLGKPPQAWRWWEQSASGTIGPGGDVDFWRIPYRSTVNADRNPDALDAPGSVVGDTPESRATRHGSRHVLNTQMIMGMLLNLPANRDAMQKLSADRYFVPEWVGANANERVPTPGADGVLMSGGEALEQVYYLTGAKVLHRANAGIQRYLCTVSHQAAAPPSGVGNWATDVTPPTPVLLDAWDNPIIFVPGTGLRVRKLNGQQANNPASVDQTFIVISPEGQVSDLPNQAPSVTKPGRPFFASAGPDGDFAKGDDNLYSFEQ
jgi:prepilin-type N-terminal cleavage/methylation domain-containing protein